MSEEERLEGKIQNKNWKERQEGYSRLGSIWEKSEECIGLLPLLQNETNIPAMESAIDAILKVRRPPHVVSVRKIFSNIGNIKTSIRTRIFTLIDFVAQEYPKEVVKEMVSLLSSKTPKTVSGAVSALVEITAKYEYSLDLVGESLKPILGHSDKAVRAEGTKLCVELYKKHGDGIRHFIKEVKAIQLKELEEAFSQIQVEEKEEEEETSSRRGVSSSLIKKCNDEKWNIRLEGLSELKKIVKGTKLNSEILSLLHSRINDPNNQVLFEVLEILSITKVKNQRLVNGLIERLKDKKAAVTDKVKEALLQMEIPEEFIQKEFFTHKNPQVKVNVIDYVLQRGVEKKEIVEWVRGCTKDPSVQVRNKAVEALTSFENKTVGNSIITKQIPTPIKRVKVQTPQKSPARTVTKPLETNSYFGPTREEKESVLESFYFKFPFFQEKNWSLRLEGLKEATPALLREEPRDLAIFFFSHRESVFQLNLAFLDLLTHRGELDTVRNTVLLCCVEKITEVKLQKKIAEVVRQLDTKESLCFLKNEIKGLKQGKKLVSLLWLVGEIITKGNCEIDEILKKEVTGISEKKAIEKLKEKYQEVNEEEEEDVSDRRKDSFINESVVKDKANESYKDSSKESVMDENESKFVSKDKQTYSSIPKEQPFSLSPQVHLSPQKQPSHFSPPPNLLSECINETLTLMQTPSLRILKITERKAKGKDKEEEVFTPAFLKFKEESDFNTVVDAFSSIDRVLVSDFVISFYVEKKLASSFFNSLLLFFISEKYILQEGECVLLLRHLLENNFKEELKMMDRVYPVTKLFFVLQKIGTEEAHNEILRLIDFYKMFRGDRKRFVEEMKRTNRHALQKAIRECQDFLSFVDEIDGQFVENEESKERRGEESKQRDKSNTVLTPLKKSKDAFHSFTPLLRAPSVLDSKDEDFPIESSLHSLSLNSQFCTPKKKAFKSSPLHREKDSLEDVLDNLIDSNQEKSEKAFTLLSQLVDEDISSLLFSANSIVSSISIQLLDVLHRPLYASLILNVLLKLSKSRVFCEQLRVETLESVNADLIEMFDTPSFPKDKVLDIITNLSLNSRPLVAVEVYLNLFTRGGNRDVHLRLLWRHSKALNGLSEEEVCGIVEVFERFYSKNVFSPLLENRTTFKMLTLHIGQLVLKYPKELESVKLRGHTKTLVGLFKEKISIKIEDLRIIK